MGGKEGSSIRLLVINGRDYRTAVNGQVFRWTFSDEGQANYRVNSNFRTLGSVLYEASKNYRRLHLMVMMVMRLGGLARRFSSIAHGIIRATSGEEGVHHAHFNHRRYLSQEGSGHAVHASTFA